MWEHGWEKCPPVLPGWSFLGDSFPWPGPSLEEGPGSLEVHCLRHGIGFQCIIQFFMIGISVRSDTSLSGFLLFAIVCANYCMKHTESRKHWK